MPRQQKQRLYRWVSLFPQAFRGEDCDSPTKGFVLGNNKKKCRPKLSQSQSQTHKF
jgi:hypothetical protein